MLIKFKKSVFLPFISSEMLRGLWYFSNIVKEVTPTSEITVTAVLDGLHKEGSLHPLGKAVDIRSHVYSKELIAKILQKFTERHRNEFDLLWEDAGLPNEHFHLEYDPKED